MNRSMRPVSHQDGTVVCDLVRREKRSISTHMHICTCVNPPICGLTNRKYGKQITVPRCTIIVAQGHIDRLESCPGFLYLSGHLFSQCSSEPQVKQPPFPFSFFL